MAAHDINISPATPAETIKSEMGIININTTHTTFRRNKTLWLFDQSVHTYALVHAVRVFSPPNRAAVFFLSIHTPFEIKPTYFIFHYILMHNIYIFIFVVYFRIGPTRSVKSRSDCVAHRFQFLERSSINIIVLFCCSSSSSGAAGASVNVGKREIEVLGLGKTKANWPHRLQRKQKTHIHWCIVVHTCTN